MSFNLNISIQQPLSKDPVYYLWAYQTAPLNLFINVVCSTHMKKILIILSGLVLLSIPLIVAAAEMRAGREYTLRQEEVVQGDLYAVGGTVSVSGTVAGDALIAGGTILVSGKVQQDIATAGGTINISGTVGDDVRVVGGTVTIGGKISGDLVVAGGQVHILSDASIDGDVVVFGGSVVIEGRVGGTVRSKGGEVTINGNLNSRAEVTAGKVTVGDYATIAGNLEYTSPNEATISGDAKIHGERIFHKREIPQQQKNTFNRIIAGLFGAWTLVKFLMLFVAGLVFVLVFRTIVPEVVKNGFSNFWQGLGRGFVVFVVLPSAAFVAMVTVIGIPLGVLLLLIYIMSLIAASVYSVLFTGAWVEHLMRGNSDILITWKTALIGTVVWTLVGLIPIVGGFVKCILLLFALGRIAQVWRERVWDHR